VGATPDFIAPLKPLIFWVHSQKRLSDWVFYSTFLFLSVLLVAPLWQVYYLPLSDLPDHAAQLHVILNYSQYEADYRINWFTPYLVGYLLALFFSLIFPIPIALKLALSLALVCVPLACLYLLRQLKGNRYWVWICFPVAHSFSFYWGFYSYIIATPLALFLVAYAVAYRQGDITRGRFATAAGLSALVFLGHAMAWAMAIVLVALTLWIGRDTKSALKRFTPFVLVVPLVVYWAANVGPESQKAQIQRGHYTEHYLNRVMQEVSNVQKQWQERTEKQEHPKRAQEMLSIAIGKPLATDYVLLTLLLLTWPLLSGAKIHLNPKWWLPTLSVVAALMVVPYWMFDTFYVYLRFAVFLIPASFFLYRYEPQQLTPTSDEDCHRLLRSFACHAGALFVVFGILQGVNKEFRSFQDNDRAFSKVLEHMADNKKVLAMMFNQDSMFQISPPYLHYGSWYQAVKGGEVMMSFSHDSGAQNVPVRYRHTTWPVPDPWSPKEFEWEKHQANRYDYFLVRSNTDQTYKLFSQAPGRIVLDAHFGPWYLYRAADRLPEPHTPNAQ
jgi:hypothetical protein